MHYTPGYQPPDTCQHPQCNNPTRKNSRSRFCHKHRNYSTLQRWKAAAQSARRRRLAFNLGFKKYLRLLKKGCFYCGANLLMMVGTALDRRNNKHGYSERNSIPCCATCNYVRGSYFSVGEFKKVIDFVRQMRDNKKQIWPEFTGLRRGTRLANKKHRGKENNGISKQKR